MAQEREMESGSRHARPARPVRGERPLVAGCVGWGILTGPDGAGATNQQGLVVVASPHARWHRRVQQALAGRGFAVSRAWGARTACLALEQRDLAGGAAWLMRAESGLGGRLGGARSALPEPAVALVVIDLELPDGSGWEVARAAARMGVGAVLVSDRANVADAVGAMQSGVLDLLARNVSEDELGSRLDAAVRRARQGSRERRQVARLQRICRRIGSAKRLVAQQVETLCSDLVQAYQELSEQMNRVTIASEFNSLIRQELDVESLLRTTLEFVLAKSGPTNAAVFLPTTSGDYSLGAYVNYDCPKETVDILLDHMANAIAPRFEELTDIAHLTKASEQERYIGGDGVWMGEPHVIAFACRHEKECLSIFVLFREKKTPYPAALVEQMKTVRDLFTMQLAKVIKIHHRHIPKDKWGALGDPEDESGDIGGMAA